MNPESNYLRPPLMSGYKNLFDFSKTMLNASIQKAQRDRTYSENMIEIESRNSDALKSKQEKPIIRGGPTFNMLSG